MTDAFVDESWLSATPREDYLLAVVSVITSQRRRLQLITRRIKKHAGRLKAQSELKASASSPQIARRFLHALAAEPDVEITAAIWRGKRGEIEDYEALYQRVMARCVWQVVKRHPRCDVFIDKRYTNPNQQHDLEGGIREAIAGVRGNIVRVFQETSHAVQELAAPDFVAWAFVQRYGFGHEEFYRLIRSKVAHFDDLSAKKKSGSP